MTRVALFASIVLGSGSLALGYAGAGWTVPSIFILALGMIWVYAQWRGLEWSSMTGLAIALFTAAVGLLIEINLGWMFAGALFALFACDLIEFRNRLRFAFIDSNTPGIEKRHLLRLGILAIVAISLVLLITFVHLHFNFGWLVFLALVTAFGIAQLVLWFRQI